MAAPGLHIIFLYADAASEWNCSQWRALSPSDAINAEHGVGRTPHTAKLFQLQTAINWNHPKVQYELGFADVLVFQRNILIPEVWAAMDYWRALGKTVVVDLDDHYPDLPPSNPAFEYWQRNKIELNPPPVPSLVEGLKHADALTSPGKVILLDHADVVPGYWLPNWTRWAWYEPLEQKPVGGADFLFSYANKEERLDLAAAPRPGSEGEIVIGWGGSISHVDSWLYSGAIEALDKLFEKHPNVRLKFCGGESRLDTVFARWGDKVIRQGGVKPEDWPLVVSTFDIGIAPLDMRPLDPPWREGAPVASYDERRSWLKGVEYLTAGVPWVGSAGATYDDLSHMGRLVANTPEAWFEALDTIVTNLAYEKAQAWAKRKWAKRKVTLESNVNKMCDTYGRIIAEKASRLGGFLPGVGYTSQRDGAGVDVK